MTLDLSTLSGETIAEAYSAIKGDIHRTPVLMCKSLSLLASDVLKSRTSGSHSGSTIKLFFKCENFQKTGAFKIRGATYSLTQLSDEELRRGLVTQSTGNHAQALACAARMKANQKGFQIPTYVVIPRIATPTKIAAAEEYGAEIHFSGYTLPERQALASKVQISTGATMVPPSDSLDILVGQGTVMLEFLEQVEALGDGKLDVTIMPCGGGGLLAGCAVACKGTGVRVFGSEPSEGGADDVTRGLQIQQRIDTVDSLTIADGLRSPVGKLNWQLISRSDYVEGVFAVSDRDIRKAMKLVLERMGVVIEPSSAVPLATVLYNSEFQQALLRGSKFGELKIGIILTGGNTTMEQIVDVLKDTTDFE